MAILSKGHTFANADDVTSTKLNNLVDAAAFVTGSSGSTDDSSLEVNGSGRLQVKDVGITSAKLASSAVTTAKIANSTSAADGVTYAKLQRVANMKALGNVSGSLAVASELSILDEDTMSSNSDTALCTQQSIKAYVDTTSATSQIVQLSTIALAGASLSVPIIPVTAKRVTVSFTSLSTSGTSPIILRLGTISSVQTTGYLGSTAEIKGTPTVDNETTGILLNGSPAASDVWHGSIVLNRVNTTYLWSATITGGNSNTNTSYAGGFTKDLTTDFLYQVQITTVGGTDTFDSGTMCVSYER